MSKETDNSWTEQPDVIYVDPTPKPPPKKSPKGCIISIVIFIAAVLGILVYGAISFGRAFNTEYKKFDDKKIAFVENDLECKIPEGVTPIHYLRKVGAGDSATEFWVEGISDPDAYMEAAYGDTDYKIVNKADVVMIDKNNLAYDNTLTEPEVIVSCEFKKPEDSTRYLRTCLLAFYRDGDTWKMKQYGARY